jgi:hypothetical protein
MIKEKGLVYLRKRGDDHMLTWYGPASKPEINSGQGQQTDPDKNRF